MLFRLRLWFGAQDGHVAAASAPPAAGDGVGASLGVLAVSPPPLLGCPLGSRRAASEPPGRARVM